MAKKYFVEELNPNFGYFYSFNRTLKRKNTKFQCLNLIETNEFGRVLTLDGITQVAEKDEFQYHEVLVHPALTTHPEPKDCLVIGGGDGGALREVLRHRCVRRAVMAELDGDVIKFCEKEMPKISAGAFDDRRTELVVGDGRKYVEENPGRFDTINMDMTDPFGPSIMLYTRDFFGHIKRAFRNKNGVFSMHVESPITRPRMFASIVNTLEATFEHVSLFYIYIQMYSTLWAIAVCSDTQSAARLDARRVDGILKKRGVGGLRVYTGATHAAMQVEYPYLTATRGLKAPVLTDKNALKYAVSIRRHDIFGSGRKK